MRTLLGIDIGGTRLKCGLVAETGEILRAMDTHSPASVDDLRQALLRIVPQVAGGQTPAAVGFGCKGIIDPQTTEVLVLPGMWGFLTGLRLDSLLTGLVPPDTPATADNDAKAALAGESVWGAARGRRNALLLTLGTGIGGAALVDGRIVRGAGGVAGHFGHITVDPEGPICICGNQGCLETFFSARAIEAAAWSLVHLGGSSPMAGILRAHPETLSARFVFEQAALGDPLARHVLNTRIRLFGGALAGLLHAFDPEIVILSGSIADAGAAVFEPLQNEINWRVQGLLQREVPLVPTGLRDTSGVAGAAGLAWLATGPA